MKILLINNDDFQKIVEVPKSFNPPMPFYYMSRNGSRLEFQVFQGSGGDEQYDYVYRQKDSIGCKYFDAINEHIESLKECADNLLSSHYDIYHSHKIKEVKNETN